MIRLVWIIFAALIFDSLIFDVNQCFSRRLSNLAGKLSNGLRHFLCDLAYWVAYY